MTLRLAITDVANEVRFAFTGIGGDMAHAATAAMREGGLLFKTQGRANIGAAGFSSRWQNAWRVSVYPVKGDSLEPAAYGFHKIPYSDVFETGATITGKAGLLWLPIGNNVPKAGRRKVATPRDLRARGVKLFSMKGAPGRPLIGADIRVPASQAQSSPVKLSLSKLAKGTAGKRGVVKAVPLFFGIRSMTLRRRFNISGVAAQITATLGDSYFRNLPE
jgi:hypothetical protein